MKMEDFVRHNHIVVTVTLVLLVGLVVSYFFYMDAVNSVWDRQAAAVATHVSQEGEKARVTTADQFDEALRLAFELLDADPTLTYEEATDLTLYFYSGE